MDQIINHNARAERAKELFTEGYNCSQAVLAAFCDLCGLSIEDALKISSSFGGGMGRMREVCGAMSAVFMAAGMIYGYTSPKDSAKKTEHYKRIQALASEFKKENGSIVCRELLGLCDTNPTPEARTAEYYKKRPCAELVFSAAEILEEYIRNNPQ